MWALSESHCQVGKGKYEPEDLRMQIPGELA